MLMAKQKQSKLYLSYNHKPIQLLDPKVAEELKQMIREINRPAEEAMRKRRLQAEWDNLPPAA